MSQSQYLFKKNIIQYIIVSKYIYIYIYIYIIFWVYNYFVLENILVIIRLYFYVKKIKPTCNSDNWSKYTISK